MAEGLRNVPENFTDCHGLTDDCYCVALFDFLEKKYFLKMRDLVENDFLKAGNDVDFKKADAMRKKPIDFGCKLKVNSVCYGLG